MSAIFGMDKDIFFPKFREDFHLTSFTDIAREFSLKKGYEPFYCSSEDEAREKVCLIDKQKKWPYISLNQILQVKNLLRNLYF